MSVIVKLCIRTIAQGVPIQLRSQEAHTHTTRTLIYFSDSNHDDHVWGMSQKFWTPPPFLFPWSIYFEIFGTPDPKASLKLLP